MRRSNANHQPSRSEARKKKGFSFTTFLGILLILIAIGLLLLNPIKNYMIAQKTENITVPNITREQVLENQQKDVSFDFANVTAIDPMTVISDGVNPSDLPVIGGIAIPDLDMNLPINMGTSNEGMYYGAGTLFPDQEMGHSNYPLASHHSSDPELLFAPLLEAKNGQLIYLTDLEKVYIYEIDNVMTVSPNDGYVLDPSSHPIVTLITCTYDLQNRIVVQGSLIEEVPIEQASDEMMAAFDVQQTIVQ